MAYSNNTAVASEVNTAVAKQLNDHLCTDSSTTTITLAEESNVEAEDLVVVSNDAEVNMEEDQEAEEERMVSTHTNSNYQAVNSSPLVAGSCAVNDPGVDVVVVEHVDEIRDYYYYDEDIDGGSEW